MKIIGNIMSNQMDKTQIMTKPPYCQKIRLWNGGEESALGTSLKSDYFKGNEQEKYRKIC